MSLDVFQQSLVYHRRKPYGKLSITPTKPLSNREDLALAYSPGVGSSCLAIQDDPSQVAELTARQNLIAVITNGTAVLGYGDIGALASKPVMEGKAVLFKKFAGVDAFDIEINEKNQEKLVDIIASLEPTFGGINLEDIKAPECFYIEQKLRERLNIPVFHDDQHGTAITVAAAFLNGLKILKKDIEKVKIVVSGAGAAAIACLELLVELGLKKENVIMFDSKGAITKTRGKIDDPFKELYACVTEYKNIGEAMDGADVFLGLSKKGVINKEDVKRMAANPLILALANPDPEILPGDVHDARPDAIVATGRSDFKNQVNNAICFPYIFRGALDVGATTINKEMKIACVKAIAELAQAESSDVVSNAYDGEIHRFGVDFIIPKPFDPRLFVEISYVVAKTAMETGVATRPIADMQEYKKSLHAFIYGSSITMQPVFARAKQHGNPKTRIAFAEGEEERVLQAVQSVVDEKIGRPILVGRPDIIERRIKVLGLRIKAKTAEHPGDFDVVDPGSDSRYQKYWTTYHRLTERKGISPEVAKTLVRTNTTIIAAMLVHLGDADTMICGVIGRYLEHYSHVKKILGVSHQFSQCAALAALVVNSKPLFICDPYLNVDPTAEQLVELTLLSAEQVRRFGITPKVALVSHSNFGASSSPSARKMQSVLQMLRQVAPHVEVEGEMQADLALCPDIRNKIFPNSNLEGSANLLIMPNIESANISLKMAQALGNESVIGPILMGMRGSAQILTPTMSVRGIVDMTALAVVDALEREEFIGLQNIC